MNAAFALPALRGDNPLGFLAALGVIEVATSAGDDIQLSWTAPSSPAVITSSTVSGLDDLAERLSHNARPSFSDTIAPLAERLTPAALRASLLQAQRREIADRQTQWLTSIVTDLGTRQDGARGGMAPIFQPTGGQTANQCLATATDLCQRHPDELHRALSAWRRTPGYDGANLDPNAKQPSLATGAPPENRGAAGPTWLALRSAPMFHLAGDGTHVWSPAWPDAGKTLRWPLWQPPLDRDAIVALLAHPAVATTRLDNGTTNHRLRSLGVTAILESTRQYLRRSRGPLGPTTLVYSQPPPTPDTPHL
jgi:hypothetical protein